MNGVSIVICCFNSSKRIVETLRYLQKQNLNNSISWEVIVVDNASIDNTSSTALKIWKENPVTKFRIVSEENPGLMNARYKGYIEAKYEIVSFIDDDNWVESRWIEKVYSIFLQDKNIGACGGKVEAAFENEMPDWFEEFANSFAVGKQSDQTGYIENKKGFLWGAGLTIRKSLWQELESRNFKNLTLDREGYSLSAGGDTELCYAFRLLGYRIYYRDDLLMKHYIPSNRLNINYLSKIHEGFGRAYGRLNCYRVLLDKTKFKLYPWWYEWVSAKRKIISFSLLQIFVFNKKKKIKIASLKSYLKGYAEMVWLDKNSIRENINTLRKMFS